MNLRRNKPRRLRVDTDSRGWNIVEREGHRYVESCGLICSVAVKRAIELAGPEGTVEVLDTQRHRYVLVHTPGPLIAEGDESPYAV